MEMDMAMKTDMVMEMDMEVPRGRKKKSKQNLETDIGIQHVQSLYHPGEAVKILMDQTTHMKPRIKALQKIRWMGDGVLEK